MVQNKTNDDDRARSTDRNKSTQPTSATKMIPLWWGDNTTTIFTWKGRWKKIAATNDVGDDGIVDGSSAITKTMRIRACLIGRQIRILFWSHVFPPCKYFTRDPSHIFISNNLTNRERAPWATIVLTAYFFGGYWRCASQIIRSRSRKRERIITEEKASHPSWSSAITRKYGVSPKPFLVRPHCPPLSPPFPPNPVSSCPLPYDVHSGQT